MKPVREIATMAMIILSGMLSACGGDSGAIASAPPPLPLPTQSPSPARITPQLAAPTVPLLAPIQTASPSAPEATPGGPSFNTSPGKQAFPLLQTAVTANFDGDRTTTEQGATITFGASPGDVTLLANNPLVSASPLRQSVGSQNTKLPDGTTFNSWSAEAPALDYTRFGIWDASALDFVTGELYIPHQAAWVTGYTTPIANIPFSGTATYSGETIASFGRHYASCACTAFASGIGKVTISADFSANAISGSITELILSDAFPFAYPTNVLAFTAIFNRQANQFNGSTRVVGPAEPIFGFDPNASGTIAGRFFGLGASEVGGVWTLSDSASRMIGSFGAKQTGP